MPYGPEGSLDAKIIVVAEAPARQEMIIGRPLVGPSGELFDQLCMQAKLSRRSMYLTNVVDESVSNIKHYISQYGNLSGLGHEMVGRLSDELAGSKSNVIICMGNFALKALTGQSGVLKYRGSILSATLSSIEGAKVIPTIHPAATFRGQYLWRYNILRDLQRVKRECEFSEVRRPKYAFSLAPTFEDCLAWLDLCCEKKRVSVDIEIGGRHVTRISFALDGLACMSIPFSNSAWSPEQEAQLWLAVQQVLGDPEVEKVGQNFTFDMTFMMTQCNILTRGKIDDTMIAHHILYPDFPKGLGYLTSLYTDQPYYKDMVKHGTIANPNG